MKKRLIPIILLVAYAVILIKVMVFKDLPLIRIGGLMLNFGGIESGHSPNFIPFKTILPYLLGYKGLLIAGINLVGNIALLVPMGFLIPFVFPNITWKKSLIFAASAGLIIETMQVVLKVGIFDIDDVILNALGFMIGYWVFVILSKWLREKKYKNIIIAAIVALAVVAAAAYYIYPKDQVVNPRAGAGSQSDQLSNEQEGDTPQGADLCGGTGGNGEITEIGNKAFTLKLGDERDQIINLIDGAEINTPAGPGSISDLKVGDRVTLVGGPESDGSFTAEAVFLCNQ